MAQALMDGAGVSLPGGEKLGDCVTSSRRSQLFALLSSKDILFENEKSASLNEEKEPGSMFCNRLAGATAMLNGVLLAVPFCFKYYTVYGNVC